jgi:hypothetical protein
LSVTCDRLVVFSGTLVSFTNKTYHHDITEILLKVVLYTITLTLYQYLKKKSIVTSLSSERFIHYSSGEWESNGVSWHFQQYFSYIMVVSSGEWESNGVSFQQYFSYIMVVSFIGGGNTNLSQVTDNLYHIMLDQVHFAWTGFKLTTLVVIGTDCIGSYKSNYHTSTTALHCSSDEKIYRLWCYFWFPIG